MPTADENKRYEAKRRKDGFKRGPWITPEAHAALREICHQQRIQPWAMVSLLIIEASKVDAPTLTETVAMRTHGFSRDEAKEFLRGGHV
jgi:hypothetical protein